jgi:hypothetical protein
MQHFVLRKKLAEPKHVILQGNNQAVKTHVYFHSKQQPRDTFSFHSRAEP